MTAPTHATLERATAAVAGGHLALALLTAIDRAGYGGRAQGVVGAAAEHALWMPAHAAVALALLASLTAPALRVPALSVSTGTLACWSALMWAWAIQLEPDATWAVAALGAALGAVSFALSGLWADRE